jgi:hypothetical protein
MRSFCLRFLAVLALTAPLGGCIFDQDGVDPKLDALSPDASDASVDATDDGADSSVDTKVDVPDARVDPECVGAPSGSVCRYGASGDASVVGQTGRCINRQFSRDRYCFSAAPCESSSGLCTTSSCTACTSDGDCAGGGSCSVLFIAAQGARQCCVGVSSNAAGTFTDSCTRGDTCKSGLCTAAGRCYVACATSADCPGGACGAETVIIGGGSYPQLGCRSATPDSSVDSSVDGPTPDSTVDTTAPDSTVDTTAPDSTLDTTVDGPTSDTAVDSSADSVTDSSVDGAADAGAG